MVKFIKLAFRAFQPLQQSHWDGRPLPSYDLAFVKRTSSNVNNRIALQPRGDEAPICNRVVPHRDEQHKVETCVIYVHQSVT